MLIKNKNLFYVRYLQQQYASLDTEKYGHRLNHTCENQYHKTFQLATSGINLFSQFNALENLTNTVVLTKIELKLLDQELLYLQSASLREHKILSKPFKHLLLMLLCNNNVKMPLL